MSSAVGDCYESQFLMMCNTNGNIIEGLLANNRISRFGDQLKEGLVYEIESFMVTAAQIKYKAAEYSHRIKFAMQTELTEVDPANHCDSEHHQQSNTQASVRTIATLAQNRYQDGCGVSPRQLT